MTVIIYRAACNKQPVCLPEKKTKESRDQTKTKTPAVGKPKQCFLVQVTRTDDVFCYMTNTR